MNQTIERRPPGPAQRGLLALGSIACLVSLVALARTREPTAVAGTPPAHASVSTPREASFPIDVNVASEGDLERLPRIGPALAARIVEHRPYRTIDDLGRVPGIGPRTIERLAPLVTFTSPERPAAGVEP